MQAGLALQQQQPVHYQELSFEERLSLSLDQEISLRNQRKIERLTCQARFRLKAELANLYFRLKQLLAQMYLAQADRSYRKLLDKLANCHLLLLDDWGSEPLNPQQRADLLELIDARYDRTSTLITSQLPVPNWYQMIGESTHADAILDRLLHSAIKIELKGESMTKSMNKLTQGDHSG